MRLWNKIVYGSTELFLNAALHEFEVYRDKNRQAYDYISKTWLPMSLTFVSASYKILTVGVFTRRITFKKQL